MNLDKRKFIVVRGFGVFLLRASLVLGLGILGLAWWLNNASAGQWHDTYPC